MIRILMIAMLSAAAGAQASEEPPRIAGKGVFTVTDNSRDHAHIGIRARGTARRSDQVAWLNEMKGFAMPSPTCMIC